MPRPFAKLAVGSGSDEKLGIIAERNGLAGMLFLLSIPEAYPYGLLPASPRAYRAAVIPAAILTEEQISEAIDAQVETGLLHRYEVGGKQYLYVRNYHRYQDVSWSRVRQSEYPLPDCWEVPDELQSIIDDPETLAKSRKQFGAFGIMGLSAGDIEASADMPPDAPPVPRGASGVPVVCQRHQGGTSTATSTATSKDAEQPNGNDRAREENEDGERPRLTDDGDDLSDVPYLKQQYPATAQWLWKNMRHWKPKIQRRWLRAIASAIESPSDTWMVDDLQAADLLKAYPPKAADENIPAKWLERMEKQTAPKQTPQQSFEEAHLRRQALKAAGELSE